MHRKILVAALPVEGICDATDAASQLARIIRANDRSLASSDLIQLPLVDGGAGTIDFLVSNTLGSFLEVEASGSSGEEVVVPLGFAGEDGKLAVIEMSRVAPVAHLGDAGTTTGIGQLIQDALDEGAFSILLGHEEPIARDAGLGAASALGVKFFDASDKEINFALTGCDISQIARVDATSRSFSLLSSRIFIAQAANVRRSDKESGNQAFLDALSRLTEIIRRDTGIHPSTANLSASAVEFGLTALLGAEVHDGASLVFEASKITDAIAKGEFSQCIVLTPSLEVLENGSHASLMEIARSKIKHVTVIVTGGAGKSQTATSDLEFYLQDVTLFQPPVGAGAGIEEKRRDLTMRLEKLVPAVFEALREQPTTKWVNSKDSHA